MHEDLEKVKRNVERKELQRGALNFLSPVLLLRLCELLYVCS